MDEEKEFELDENLGIEDFDKIPFNHMAVKSIAVDPEDTVWAMTLHCFTGEGNLVVLNGVEVSDFFEWQAGALIQNVFPQLTAEQREMLITGIPPEEQEDMMNEVCDS